MFGSGFLNLQGRNHSNSPSKIEKVNHQMFTFVFRMQIYYLNQFLRNQIFNNHKSLGTYI